MVFSKSKFLRKAACFSKTVQILCESAFRIWPVLLRCKKSFRLKFSFKFSLILEFFECCSFIDFRILFRQTLLFLICLFESGPRCFFDIRSTIDRHFFDLLFFDLLFELLFWSVFWIETPLFFDCVIFLNKSFRNWKICKVLFLIFLLTFQIDCVAFKILNSFNEEHFTFLKIQRKSKTNLF